MSKQQAIILLILVSLILVGVCITTSIRTYKTVKPPQTVVITDTVHIEHAGYYREVYQEIQAINLEHPDIVFAQIILETGHFSSELFWRNHNLFGMRVAMQRPTTAVNKRGNAYYNTWQDSLLDYALWQCKYASGLSEAKYYTLLDQCYAEDFSYVKKLKEIIPKIPEYLSL